MFPVWSYALSKTNHQNAGDSDCLRDATETWVRRDICVLDLYLFIIDFYILEL